MFESRVQAGVLQLSHPGARWLSTGWDGGYREGPVAYNVSVPDGWDRTDLTTYVAERRGNAGFDRSGPTLLTGVGLEHARMARYGPVEAVVTADISNPATLPMEPSGEASVSVDPDTGSGSGSGSGSDPSPDVGTVNVFVGTERSLADGALANLIAVATEAKTATLLARTGVPGTTTDAVVACESDRAGEPTAFTGSATEVGAAARACVREAVSASLRSRYDDGGMPGSVDEAAYGIETNERAEVYPLGTQGEP